VFDQYGAEVTEVRSSVVEEWQIPNHLEYA